MNKQQQMVLPHTLPHTLRRNTDPKPSHDAAVHVSPRIAKLKVYALKCVDLSPGRTSCELAVIYEQRDPRTIGRRLGELERDNRIARRGPRKCNVTGRRVATWWLVT